MLVLHMHPLLRTITGHQLQRFVAVEKEPFQFETAAPERDIAVHSLAMLHRSSFVVFQTCQSTGPGYCFRVVPQNLTTLAYPLFYHSCNTVLSPGHSMHADMQMGTE